MKFRLLVNNRRSLSFKHRCAAIRTYAPLDFVVLEANYYVELETGILVQLIINSRRMIFQILMLNIMI